MTPTISIKFSTVDFLGTDAANILGYDPDKSFERYAEQLQADIVAEYPDAEVKVEWTDENLPHTIVSVEPDNSYEQHVAAEEIKDALQRIQEDLYGDFDRWMVDGFNAEAWMAHIGKQADKANTGDILTITIAKASPQETQDVFVEAVVLEAGQGDLSDVAYRYSTHSYDESWQLGTVRDAVDHADVCYQSLAEKDEEASE